MSKVFLCLGSNIGDRERFLSLSKNIIEHKLGFIEQSSSVFESQPWGVFSNEDDVQRNYINQVIKINTILNPFELLKNISYIEAKLGRTKKILSPNAYEARTIDIDILFYDNLIINKSGNNQYGRDLIIPHPLIHERKFVLLPLNEIDSSFIHPVFNKSIKDLMILCNDKNWVVKISSGNNL